MSGAVVAEHAAPRLPRASCACNIRFKNNIFARGIPVRQSLQAPRPCARAVPTVRARHCAARLRGYWTVFA